MKTLRIKHGLQLSLSGKPEQRIFQPPEVYQVAWQRPENTVIQADNLVRPGQQIALGAPLFVDRHSPEIAHVAPASGVVSHLEQSDNRGLLRIEIDCADVRPVQFNRCAAPLDQAEVRNRLLISGLWTHIRHRPYNRIPPSNSQPSDILVTAIDTRPLAADPSFIIKTDQQAFDLGLEALRTQTNGKVWVCQAVQQPLTTLQDGVESVAFDGKHPAGLAGIHIQHLCPVDKHSEVWQIDCQDVMAIGALLRDGELQAHRVISLAGDQINKPRLVQVPLGAKVADVIAGQLVSGDTPVNVCVGSPYSNRSAGWLNVGDRQIWVSRMMSLRTRTDTTHTEQYGTPPDYGPLVAEPRFDRVNALDILPVPLLRALLTQDIESAQSLGCLELSAEDLELFNYVCPVGNDYMAALDACNQRLQDDHYQSSGLAS